MRKLNNDELAQAHDRQDWHALWLAARPLVKFTFRRMIQRGEVDPARWSDPDINQEGLLAAGLAVRSWDTLEGSFSTWVCAQIRGALLDLLKGENNGGVGGRQRSGSTVSLQEQVLGAEDFDEDEDEGTPKQDLLSYPHDEVIPSVETAVERANAVRLLDRLAPLDKEIALRLFGLGLLPHTEREAAEALGVSRRRVRLLARQLWRCTKPAEAGPNDP